MQQYGFVLVLFECELNSQGGMVERLIKPPAAIMIFNSQTGMCAGFLFNLTWDLNFFLDVLLPVNTLCLTMFAITRFLFAVT